MKRGGLLVLGVMGVMVAFALPAAAQAAPVSGDFDGDGKADLAVGARGQTVSGHTFAGAVQVIYGSHNGPSGSRDRIFTEDTPGVKQTAADHDNFGTALAAGRFNGDRFADLAIGSPFKDIEGKNEAGMVHILYGSRHGLRTRGSQLLIEGRNGLKGSLTAGNDLGFSLAAGNLGRSPEDDLAIGTPYADVGGQDNAGALQVVYGSAKGLRGKHSRRLTQNTPHVRDHSEPFDEFGWSLVAADFGHDGHADLATGDREESVGSASDAGGVNVLYGSRRGVRTTGNQFFSQDTPGVKDSAEPNDVFGFSLAAADFGRNRRADLAIGAFGEGVGAESSAGAANVLYGSRKGLRAKRSQFFTQTELELGDGSQSNQGFGLAFAAANLGRGKPAELAVGVPNECVTDGVCVKAGAVDVIYGSRHGLTRNGAEEWNQDTPGVQDQAEVGDGFGTAVTAARFRGTKVFDLAIGIPGEGVVNTNDEAGAVSILRGSPGGVTASGDQFLTRGSGGLEGTPEQLDLFGSQLSGPKSTALND